MKKQEWFKIKGYYHISPPSKVNDIAKTINKIKNPNFISKYSFYPLLHTNIIERKFKKHPKTDIRCHSYFDEKKAKFIKTIKVRPLHYANHFDALIFGYYASLLQEKYEVKLKGISGLSECVTAYRKIPIINSIKHKGTIHFAHEAFSEIKNRVEQDGEIAVLAFDIKSFFSSLDHSLLREYWKKTMDFDQMKSDHDVVLRAATKFSFIYKDDLRKHKQRNRGRRSNFDEKKLATIGNKKGFNAFFDSPRDFRENIKNGSIHIFKNSFRNEKKEMIGIPQGLPISAVLANLYLLEFDKIILDELVKEKGCFYRRYSDDIVIVCSESQIPEVRDLVYSKMKQFKVVISEEKTETFLFKTRLKNQKVYSSKITSDGIKENIPFIYLGFEFYGYKTLIKSSNLSKFYRRMIYSVKAKSKIAHKVALRDGETPVLFKKQLYKIYRNINLDKVYTTRKFKAFEKKDNGEFRLVVKESNEKSKMMGNYFSYARRAAEIMNEPAILNQIKGERKIFNQAIQKHFYRKKEINL